jgi:anti-sigma-K factor RskA
MSEIHGAVGSYVINALDPAELDEFEAHLAVCPTCSREVVEFCETAAELSLLATVSAPPPALRSSVLSAISQVRVLPPVLPPVEGEWEENLPRRSTPEPTPPVDEVPPTELDASISETAAPIDELALRRARRRTRVLSLAVAAAMVVALSLGGWVIQLRQAQQAQVASVTAETELLKAPDVQVKVVPLKDGGQASFVVSKQQNRALFIGTGLPNVSDKTLQLWTVQGSSPVSAGLVPGSGDQRYLIEGGINTAGGVAVSLEQAGGAAQPTDIQTPGIIAI